MFDLFQKRTDQVICGGRWPSKLRKLPLSCTPLLSGRPRGRRPTRAAGGKWRYSGGWQPSRHDTFLPVQFLGYYWLLLQGDF